MALLEKLRREIRELDEDIRSALCKDEYDLDVVDLRDLLADAEKRIVELESKCPS